MQFKQWIEARQTIACGDCFRYANRLAKEMVEDGVIPEDQIRVCHGTVVAPLSQDQKRFEHAWVESRGRVYDWQMKMSGKGSLEAKDFYELFQPKDVVKYSFEQTLVNQLRHKHHGPWSSGT